MTEYVLEILDGDRVGETIPLGTEPITLGRKDSNSLKLNDEKVSGKHAEIVFQDGGYVLRDLESRNGTLLDGRRIDEIVLTSFDSFQIGRVLIQFREKGVEGLAMHRIDQDRLTGTKPRRGVMGLVIGLVVAAGAGGWFSYQQSQSGAAGPAAGREKAVPVVAGNKIARGADSCEEGEGWELSVAGTGFELGGPAHTGASALQAVRLQLEDGEEGVVADFAVARSAEPIRATSGEKLRLTGYVQTSSGGMGALRLRFSSSDEFVAPMWSGSHPVQADDYVEVSLDLAMPPGMDRVEVEVLALLPDADSEVLVDDIALVPGGDGTIVDLNAAAFSLLSFGGSLSLRAANDTVVARIEPAAAASNGLAAAGLSAITDVASRLSVTGSEDGFRVETSPPVSGLRLVLTSRAAGGLRIRDAEGGFRLQTGDFSGLQSSEILLGSGSARLMLRLDEPSEVVGERRGDDFLLLLPSASAFDAVVKFSDQRAAAQVELQKARDAVRDGVPGRALDLLGGLIEKTPHDSGLLSEASRLRADLRGQLAQRLEELGAHYRQALFFKTRGAFVRIGDELAQTVKAFGQHNFSDPEEVAAVQEQVVAQLAALDAETNGRRRGELSALAQVFAQAGEDELKSLVDAYIEKHHSN